MINTEKKKYSALILDMDGTIMNSLPVIVKSMNILSEKKGFNLTDEHIFQILYSTNDSLMDAIGVSGDKDERDKFLSEWMEIYHGMSGESGIFTGMQEVIGLPVKKGIVTSENHGELLYNLERLGIDAGLFDALVGADDTPYHKPHPFPLLHCIEMLGERPENAIYIGDGPYDIQCAIDAGVDFGLAEWGAISKEGFDAAKYRFASPRDLLEFCI